MFVSSRAPNLSQIQVYTTSGSSSTTNAFQIWKKPPCSWVSIFMVAGGGGGGGGRTAVAGNNRGGGGGGGSGGYTLGIWPAFMIPDMFFVFVGLGGSGGAAGTAGTGGTLSMLKTQASGTNAWLSAGAGGGGEAVDRAAEALGAQVADGRAGARRIADDQHRFRPRCVK